MIADAELDDHPRRLQSARWPAEITGAGWDYGTDQSFLRSLVEQYWRI